MSSTSNILTMLTTSYLLLFLSTIPPSYNARILLDLTDPPPVFQHQTEPSMSFFIQDVITTAQPARNINNPQQQLPFSKPLPTFPPIFRGIIPLSRQIYPSYGAPTITLGMPGFGISMPATANLEEELEFGSVTNIEQDMYVENGVYGPTLVGKAKGIYVAMSSEDGHSHMMAMTASFSVVHEDKKTPDRLKFFGVHRRDVSECHVAVIGGSGKFKNANGYATIRVVTSNKGSNEESSEGAKKLLLYTVYLS